jgi:hypothetical protein
MTDPTSDRLTLAVRWTRDGHREWLDAEGTTALVYWEGQWFSRPNAGTMPSAHDTETSALSALLDADLRELRDRARPELRGKP